MRRLLPLALLLAIPAFLAACGGGGGGGSPTADLSSPAVSEAGRGSATPATPVTARATQPAPDGQALTSLPPAIASPTASGAVTGCDFSRPVNLRPATSYDISGNDEYDTLVCGYLKLVEQKYGKGNVLITIPYFVLVDYADENFIRAVDAGIQRGNLVNRMGPVYREFNLGCYQDGGIVGIERADGRPYIDLQTEQAILSSSPEHLVSLVLSFGYHGGSGCLCCNLAHKVRLY